MKWKEEQPKDGDRVVFCGHHGIRMHWWKVEEKIVFRRSDGSVDRADWIVACQGCFLKHGENPLKIPIRTDGLWQGDAPVIRDGS